MELIAKLQDNEYEYKGITHTRSIARAILLNEKNEVCLLKVYGDDDFGHRDYYETPGGGINPSEDYFNAVIREINEETGINAEVIAEIGLVDDYYNAIYRHNLNYYYLLRVISYGEPHLEEDEKKIITSSIFVTIDEAINLYEKMTDTKIARLVKNRELPVLLKAKKMIEEFGG